MILTPGDRCAAVHGFLHYLRESEIEGIRGFGVLEVDIGVLSRAAQGRMHGIEGTVAERAHLVPVDQGSHCLIGNHIYGG